MLSGLVVDAQENDISNDVIDAVHAIDQVAQVSASEPVEDVDEVKKSLEDHRLSGAIDVMKSTGILDVDTEEFDRALTLLSWKGD